MVRKPAHSLPLLAEDLDRDAVADEPVDRLARELELARHHRRLAGGGQEERDDDRVPRTSSTIALTDAMTVPSPIRSKKKACSTVGASKDPPALRCPAGARTAGSETLGLPSGAGRRWAPRRSKFPLPPADRTSLVIARRDCGGGGRARCCRARGDEGRAHRALHGGDPAVPGHHRVDAQCHADDQADRSHQAGTPPLIEQPPDAAPDGETGDQGADSRPNPGRLPQRRALRGVGIGLASSWHRGHYQLPWVPAGRAGGRERVANPWGIEGRRRARFGRSRGVWGSPATSGEISRGRRRTASMSRHTACARRASRTARGRSRRPSTWCRRTRRRAW